jgi:hypothetical protein
MIEIMANMEEKQETSAKVKKSWMRYFSKKHSIYFVLCLVILSSLFGALYFYVKYQDASSQIKAVTTKLSQDEVKTLIAKVSALVELPAGETPTIATVSDVEKLKEQVFFKRAKNGDKVLIYAEAGRAVLYRPETNKIIEIGPVIKPAAQENQASASGTLGVGTTPTPVIPRIVLLNGTGTTGLTKTAETALTEAGLKIEVIDRDNAKKQDYEKSTVVDVTGKNSKAASEIASALGIKIGSLPEGEIAPQGIDILVILGSDFVKN